ncbi:MAG: RHS repeat domain-containing protein [Anaerolineaceae bacterium]
MRHPRLPDSHYRNPGRVRIPGVTIDYTYDGLYRLTKAEYSTGEVFEYTYDATGNRLSQTVTIDEVPVTTTYTYDEANRLSQVGAQTYTWDNNGRTAPLRRRSSPPIRGNLLNDGQRQYSYNPANRLTALVEGEDTTYYLYNGQGDRIAQIEDGVQTPYILDLNAGLTQVLNDGTSAYVYGLDLVSQQTGINEEYPLRDALGSVRQMTDQSSAITGYKSFEPYGSLLTSSGDTDTPYGFAGDWTDASWIQYLRALYYEPAVGRFLSKDSWNGDLNKPTSLNKWLYGYSNPIALVDPSGLSPSRPDVLDGKAIYSCNCGWVDLPHANPINAAEIYDLLNANPSTNGISGIRENLMALWLKIPIPENYPLPELLRNVLGVMAVVERDLDQNTKDRVAFGIYMARENLREASALPATPFGGNSGFSEEDLSSDVIGFYMYTNGIGDARYDANSWNWLAQHCGFNQDNKKAIDDSLHVYDKYYFTNVYKWFSPRLECPTGLCNNQKWPREFGKIDAILSSPGGIWWKYASSIFNGALTP